MLRDSAHRLRRLFDDLVEMTRLDNAAKYSEAGTAITIRGARRRPGLTIDILDNGRGLPEGEENKLFDRFRRVEGGDQQGGSSPAATRFGAVGFDAAARRVSREGEDVHLTPKEYALFSELARHPGRVVTHRELLANVWGEAHLGDIEYLRVTMRGLRAKLEADPASPALLINEPGIGYRLEGG